MGAARALCHTRSGAPDRPPLVSGRSGLCHKPAWGRNPWYCQNKKARAPSRAATCHRRTQAQAVPRHRRECHGANLVASRHHALRLSPAGLSGQSQACWLVASLIVAVAVCTNDVGKLLGLGRGSSGHVVRGSRKRRPGVAPRQDGNLPHVATVATSARPQVRKSRGCQAGSPHLRTATRQAKQLPGLPRPEPSSNRKGHHALAPRPEGPLPGGPQPRPGSV